MCLQRVFNNEIIMENKTTVGYVSAEEMEGEGWKVFSKDWENTLNALVREEMIDLLLTSYWDKAERAKSYLRRFSVGQHRFLFAVNPKDEGFFLVWESADKPSVLNRDVFGEIAAEAKAAALASRYHVYASIAPYTGAGIEFYKIPDKVLEHIRKSLL
jgi:adenine-specific DNA-methyltransferase